MASKYQAPRGTFDVLPEVAPLREEIEATATAIFERAGYERIATPIFEDTELFERGVGRSTDVVRKEMFSFEDKGGRSITLRPEGTAPICGAYLEHGMQKLAQPVKLFYSGPFFRHERPQAGRYRQLAQVFLPELDLGGRSLKGQLKHADRIGALLVLTFESDGTVQRWNRRSGDRGQIALADAVDEIRKAKEETP